MEDITTTTTTSTTTTSPVEEGVEVIIEKLYLKYPVKYGVIANHILRIYANFGEDLIKDCSATKTIAGNTILNCWLMFVSAISSYNLGNYKQADFLINYVEKELCHRYNITIDNASYVKLQIGEQVVDLTNDVFGTYIINSDSVKSIVLIMDKEYTIDIVNMYVNGALSDLIKTEDDSYYYYKSIISCNKGENIIMIK